jgi:hypothetical protein
MSTPYSEVPESLDQVLRDCRSMAGHWDAPAAQHRDSPAATGGPAGTGPHRITVSADSVRAVRGMAEYGA